VPEECVAYADASLIKRVLQNLIANALSYTPREVSVESALTIGSTFRFTLPARKATGLVACSRHAKALLSRHGDPLAHLPPKDAPNTALTPFCFGGTLANIRTTGIVIECQEPVA
jgi:hypothetical protein